MRLVASLAVVVALSVSIVACGGPTFAERDPNGYRACSDWMADVSKGDSGSILDGLLGVADEARTSTTKTIRDSVDNLVDGHTADEVGQMGLLDTDKFEKACKAQGDFTFVKRHD
jgi:hypothetical protein